MLPAAALACTPPPGGLPVFTIAQRVQAADVVLEGVVTQMSTINMPDDTATISVQRYFKGSGAASVTITNFGPTSLCRSPVHVGEHWIFFAKGDPSALMSASYLSQFDAVATPSADTIAEIIAAVNSRPRAYLPLLVGGANNIATAPSSADDHALVGLALLVTLVGAIGVWLHFAARWM
jgi:Agrin NtA domain